MSTGNTGQKQREFKVLFESNGVTSQLVRDEVLAHGRSSRLVSFEIEKTYHDESAYGGHRTRVSIRYIP